jgi:hypothetical protein
MHKMEFDPAYCKYLLNRIPTKFILRFMNIPRNFEL